MIEFMKNYLLKTWHSSVTDWSFVAAALVSLSGIFFFVTKWHAAGYFSLFFALSIASIVSTKLFRDLSLIAIALVIMSFVQINTDISYEHMLVMGSAMVAIIAIPYLISRYVYKDYAIHFPWHFREPWARDKWLYLAFVGVIGYAVLPFYMISTGVYMNWPAVSSADEVTRLFIGTNVLGIWDELFFICTVFVLLRRHFPFWQANMLQAILFTSFLFELGFGSWGPYMIFLFALIQGFIFMRTQSLLYIVTVHLLFDLIFFMVLIHAHNPTVFPIFIY